MVLCRVHFSDFWAPGVSCMFLVRREPNPHGGAAVLLTCSIALYSMSIILRMVSGWSRSGVLSGDWREFFCWPTSFVIERGRPCGARKRELRYVSCGVVYGTDVYERDRIRNESLAFASSFTKIRVLTKIETNIH